MPDTQHPSGGSAPEKTKRSRITAACAVCRAKRQKCSGEKPVCDQCRMHNEECWWSDQKKRGPAKDYLRSLQDRLQETERLLLGVLDRVPDADLHDVLQANAADNTPAPSHQTWTSALSGPEYWSQYPLNGVENVREWQRQRFSDAQRAHTTRPIKQAVGHAARSAAAHRAPEAAMTAPTAVMGGNTAAASNGMHPYYQNGFDSQDAIEPSLRYQPPAQVISHERRYSEETRDVAQALFSISNNGDAAARPQQTQPVDQDRGESEHSNGAIPKADNIPSQYPKDLFW